MISYVKTEFFSLYTLEKRFLIFILRSLHFLNFSLNKFLKLWRFDYFLIKVLHNITRCFFLIYLTFGIACTQPQFRTCTRNTNSSRTHTLQLRTRKHALIIGNFVFETRHEFEPCFKPFFHLGFDVVTSFMLDEQVKSDPTITVVRGSAEGINAYRIAKGAAVQTR